MRPQIGDRPAASPSCLRPLALKTTSFVSARTISTRVASAGPAADQKARVRMRHGKRDRRERALRLVAVSTSYVPIQ